MTGTAPAPERAIQTDAEAVLFGFDPQPVRATIQPRSSAWRMTGAAQRMGVAAVVAPVMAIVPPHAPWLIGALATGAFLARRRWTEHFTVLAVEGSCPKCGAGLVVKSGRLRDPHPLPCEGCHHDSTLKLPDGVLGGLGED